jgi:hypothetical protein
MTLDAEQEIIIKSNNTVSLLAASKLLVITPSAGISMENEIHVVAPGKVFIDRTGGAG